MKRLLGLFIIAATCAGCATQLSAPTAAEGGAATKAKLQFQNKALDPHNGGRLVDAPALRPGDILLSATNGITSAGIRLLTLSPVSHASLYVGDEQVVEAVGGGGVRSRPLAEALDEEAVVVVLRHPLLQEEHAEKIRTFALQKVGRPYDHFGIILQAPFSLERRLCELPLIPEAIRNACLHGIASIQLGTPNNDRFFCSQLVLEAYRQAGLPITAANPRWISPADILHMREGDVPSMTVHQALTYVGHLKFAPESRIAKID